MTTLGTGCGTTTPWLVLAVPHIGQTFTLSVSQAPAATSGLVFFGAPAANPFALGSGCNVLIDLATLVQWLRFATDAAGVWSASFILPNTPAARRFDLAGPCRLLPGIHRRWTAPACGSETSNDLTN